MEPPKINFLMIQRMVPVFFDISRYLRNKYFDMVWGYHPLGDLPKWIPKNEFFNGLTKGASFFYISR